MAPHVCVTHKVSGRAPCEFRPSGAGLPHRKARTGAAVQIWFAEVTVTVVVAREPIKGVNT